MDSSLPVPISIRVLHQRKAEQRHTNCSSPRLNFSPDTPTTASSDLPSSPQSCTALATAASEDRTKASMLPEEFCGSDCFPREFPPQTLVDRLCLQGGCPAKLGKSACRGCLLSEELVVDLRQVCNDVGAPSSHKMTFYCFFISLTTPSSRQQRCYFPFHELPGA